MAMKDFANKFGRALEAHISKALGRVFRKVDVGRSVLHPLKFVTTGYSKRLATLSKSTCSAADGNKELGRWGKRRLTNVKLVGRDV